MRKTWTPPLLVALMLCWIGCSTAQVDENDPAALYKDAEAEIQSDHYLIAMEKLRNIKNRFPYSKYSTDAQLRIADVYFLQESFGEAAGSYEAFRDLHPKHEKAGYAMFRTGKAYFKDTPSPISRDLTTAKKAMDSYLEFLKRFPEAQDATEARADIAEIRKQLAEKEFYIGEFYFKRDFFDSAQPRFKKVVELYPETEAAKLASEKLSQIGSRPKSEGAPKDGR